MISSGHPKAIGLRGNDRLSSHPPHLHHVGTGRRRVGVGWLVCFQRRARLGFEALAIWGWRDRAALRFPEPMTVLQAGGLRFF